MEAVNTIELCDPVKYPTEDLLKSILGKSYIAYTELLNLFNTNNMVYEWRYYKDGKAWLCKVQYKKRTIVWMSAWNGFMKATIYFPDKYVNDIYELGISGKTIEKIMNTNNVGKSKPCIFDIRTKSVLIDFNKVMQFKIKAK